MKKKLLSLILCLTMVLTLLPAAVSAAGGKIDIINVTVPYDLTAGSEMPFDSSLVTVGDPALYSAYLWAYSWTGPDGIYMPDEYTTPCFEGGETYTLTVLIVAKDGATGLDDETAPYIPVYINGERARFNPACSPWIEEAPDKTTYAYEIDLQCPYTNEIDIVEIFGFTPPTPGAVPCDINDLSVPENAPYYIRSVIWERYNGDPSTSGVTEMAAGETFTDGVYYYLNVTLCPYDGYTFSAGDVTWRINGTPYNGYADEAYSYISSPTVAKLYSADLKAEIRHIDYIDIEGLGGFYQGTTVMSAIENVTAPNAEGYRLVIEPDTCVTRYSDNTYIDRNTLFMADESYRATFEAYPDPGWTIDSSTLWTINGSAMNVSYAAAGKDYWYVKSEVFPSLERTQIDRIDIYGFNCPEIGQTAGDLLTMFVTGDLYEIEDAYWFCDTNACEMEANETFEAGKIYSACVVVKPCDPAFAFSSAVEFYLNGGSFPVGFGGAKPDGSCYIWTETMEAKTAAATHTVSWYLDPADDFAVTGVEVEDGEVFGEPAAPAKDGYTFGGWFTDRACTVPYDPTAPIYADVELFPLWIPAPSGILITAVDAQIPVPVAGQKPAAREDVTLTTTPEGAPLWIDDFTWFYWEEKIPGDNKWNRINDSDFVFVAGEQYAVDIFVRTEAAGDYVFDPAVVGTVNGQPSDDSYDDLWQSESTVYLSYVWTAQEEPPVPVDPCEGYTDIDRSKWYHDAADFVIARGLMGSTQTDALTFEPNTKVSRAMVASILYRMEGSPAVEYKGTFTDVKNGKWFTDAIEWCAQNGLASGKGNGKFDPNGNVTRQELAVFMMKMAEYYGEDTSGRNDLSSFADSASVPKWARDYVKWAVDAGLISGQASGGKTYLAPKNNATRAEFASIIMRFVQNAKAK